MTSGCLSIRSVNTRLGADHHQLIMPPISKDCLNTFLERSFSYAVPCEWNKLSECTFNKTLFDTKHIQINIYI